MNRLLKLLALFVCALALSAQTAALMPNPRIQFTNANGKPLAGGKIYTCVAGSTCPGTPLATYTDASGSTPAANPIVLDSGGFASVWLGASTYKIVAQDVNGVQQWVEDNVTSAVKGVANGVASLDANGHIFSTQMAFQQDGATSITYIIDQLKATVSVKQFGACGDGVCDDLPAFNKAAARVTAIGRGTILVRWEPISCRPTSLP